MRLEEQSPCLFVDKNRLWHTLEATDIKRQEMWPSRPSTACMHDPVWVRRSSRIAVAFPRGVIGKFHRLFGFGTNTEILGSARDNDLLSCRDNQTPQTHLRAAQQRFGRYARSSQTEQLGKTLPGIRGGNVAFHITPGPDMAGRW